MRLAPKYLLLILLSSVLVSSSQGQAMDEGFIETNGTKLYFKTIGSGEPIVVLHGGPGFDHQQFLPHLNGLADHYKVIFYDQRGTGQSEGPVDSASITIENFIEDLEGIRQAFGIEKMNLLGHSWGGILAMHYSIRHADKLKSLVLASTAASVESFTDIRAGVSSKRNPVDAALLDSIYASESFQNDDAKAIEHFWDVYFRVHFQDLETATQLHTSITKNTIRYSNEVAGHIIASLGDFDLYSQLESVEVPTLIIHGDLDLMPVSYARRTHASMPNSELVIVEGSGHWIFVDGRDVFLQSVDEFIQRRAEEGGLVVSDTLRILAYNIHAGVGMDEVVDLERIAKLIREVNPDLVALQEVDSVTSRTNGVDQSAELGRLTGLEPVFGRFRPYQGGAYGMALLSRWPVVESKNFSLPDRAESANALGVLVNSPKTGRSLRFVGIHFYRTDEERLAQSVRLEKFLSNEQAPIVLAGDFNSTPRDVVMTHLEESWMILDKGDDHLTFPSYAPDREIDYVLVRPGDRFEVLGQRLLNERVASDHRPLVVDLILKD